VRGPVVAGLVFALTLSPILLPMVLEATRFSFMVRPATDLYILSASLLDFLIPNRLHTLARPESFDWPGNQIAPVSERTIAIGYSVLALAIVALVAARRRAAFWGVAALFFLMLALGPRWHGGNITWNEIPEGAALQNAQEWTPFALLNRAIPFMRISRSVSRYSLMVQLAAAVLAGVGMAWWLDRMRRQGRAMAVGLLVLVVVLFEYWVAPYPLSPPDTPPFYQELAQQVPAGAVLNLPMNYDRPGYLLYQTVHARPLTVAYISRDDPRTLTERAPVLQHFRHLGADILQVDPVQIGQTVLHDLDVGTVVLDRYKMPGGEERSYTTELANAIFAGQAPLYADERITVYVVEAPAQPIPYLLMGPTGWGPLQEDAIGRRWRTLLEPVVELELRHVALGGSLRLRYRAEEPLRIFAPEDPGLAQEAPAAPAGGEVTVALQDLGSYSRLAIEHTGAVEIEQVELIGSKP
jgi:hypothetical protein